MRPFDQAWQLLKRYVPHGHTSLPGADIAATILPQESDEDFRDHAKYLEYRDNPAMQRRLKEHFTGYEMVENPENTKLLGSHMDNRRAATGDIGRPLNFSTQAGLGTLDDSAFTYDE
tara:strand:+ start:18458 stop:18808 length:351 start_codon:yes stop_codon:yes gene_type:complete